MKSLLFLLRQKLKNNFFFSPLVIFTIQEESMQPFLFPGDQVIVNRLRKGKKGDVIVIKNPETNSQQKYLIKKIEKINNKKLYVIGVNKEKSIDSRHFGWIEKRDIIGKMIGKL